ncbi:hypothetical protein G7K_3538-t1 [Saitoella complicata NRRL Y-17804]|uniref:Golgi SNAP receptor complex member 1 n=2 Tax=Saitoella complicata (strain BCRC 22490 / CBS 7301 / JCM 7358 / NBRC 10748 / NRRL Y-17804) TaxID=698492 RepID=A0A0E9NHV8_SAICN|nr:hypothetical protein G7K_3538-t1 [Saitoella complicata NRRL Y-17804]
MQGQPFPGFWVLQQQHTSSIQAAYTQHTRSIHPGPSINTNCNSNQLNMASSSSSWPSLRSKARSLESQTESFFLQYSALAQSSGQTSDDEALESKLTTILQERQEVINTLSRLLDMDTAANSTTKVHQLQRNREILAEHNKEFRRIKDNIEQTRNHSDLLSSVRRDIKQYKDATGLADAEAGYMLQERGTIDNSHRMADSVLAQAYETREEFARQKAALKRIQIRITETAMQIPGLNTLISKINTRKKRDSLIIALLISFCVFGLFMLRSEAFSVLAPSIAPASTVFGALSKLCFDHYTLLDLLSITTYRPSDPGLSIQQLCIPNVCVKVSNTVSQNVRRYEFVIPGRKAHTRAAFKGFSWMLMLTMPGHSLPATEAKCSLKALENVAACSSADREEKMETRVTAWFRIADAVLSSFAELVFGVRPFRFGIYSALSFWNIRVGTTQCFPICFLMP